MAASALTLLAVAPVAATSSAIVHRPRIPGPPRHNAGWASSNWSGYAKEGSYQSVTAQWVVPSVSATRKASYSSAWVGIDGFNNSSLIQTGTESDYYNRAGHYYAWWEILPAAETRISMAVFPKDVMSATITKINSTQWTITITNETHPAKFSTTQSYSGPGTSAEWIEEAPTVGGRVAPLAHYSSPDTFDPGTANGTSPGLLPEDGGVLVQNGVQVSTPSAPDSGGDGFNMAYGSTAPAAPTS